MPEASPREPLTVPARVLESLPNAMYRLELLTEERPRVTAHVAAEAHLLRLLPGDAVLVELSSYDTTRGRVVGKGPKS
jgi:translation initiation factor IF-1